MSTPTAATAASVADRLSTSRTQQLYRLRLADSTRDVEAAQRLRYEIFNIELGEGLSSAVVSGLDVDEFDAVCDHLLVEDIASNTLVGTYRVQMGDRALAGSGFYSAREFDFGPFLGRASEIVELGRACVHRRHRNLVVLGLLWKGIAHYAKQHNGRYLMGCSSLTSQDPAEGLALYHALKERHLAAPEWVTHPMPGFECQGERTDPTPVRAPKLMSAYFSIGAKICGQPAIDSEFKTIDFLTWVDVLALPERVASRYELK
ncbi:MAG: GNAT family N-acetyltransferase [Chthoniobacteraceae bacterium]